MRRRPALVDRLWRASDHQRYGYARCRL